VGSRATDKLKEIEELRASLGGKLEEIEKRLPLAGFGKKAAMAVAGSSVAGSVLAFGLRRVRGGRKKKRAVKEAPVFQPVNVNVFPKGAAWLAAAGLAAWAGVKVYEAVQRGKDGSAARPSRPSVVTPMPESGRQTGAGS
jgi:hypothetical protein